MTVVSSVFAVLAGLLHVLFFVMESVLFTRPQVYRRFGVASASDAAVLRPMALNQGYYNLFLAIGAFAAVILLAGGDETAGRTLVIFSCGCMLAAALVLVVSNPRMARAAAIQGFAPLVAIVFALV